MNTQLHSLFEEYNISEKDRYEINQIFGLLPPIKQQKILKDFEMLAFRFNKINREIETERKILIGDLFEDIKSFYIKYGDQI